MAEKPVTPNPAETSAITGDRMAAGFFSTQQLLGGGSLVVAGGGLFLTPVVEMFGFNAQRIHLDLTHPGGGAFVTEFVTYSPDTGLIEPAAFDFAVGTAFASGQFAFNLVPLLTGVIYPMWLNGFRFTNNAGGAVTVNAFKTWLTRE